VDGIGDHLQPIPDIRLHQCIGGEFRGGNGGTARDIDVLNSALAFDQLVSGTGLGIKVRRLRQKHSHEQNK